MNAQPMTFGRRRSLNWLFAYMGGNLLTVQNLTLMSYLCYIRYALKKKKRYYLGIFPKRRTPPHPPLLGTPYPKKKFSVYFAFQNLRSIFVLQKKSFFRWYFYCQFWEQGTPPPFWEKFPNNPVFFLQQDNSDNFEYP